MGLSIFTGWLWSASTRIRHFRQGGPMKLYDLVTAIATNTIHANGLVASMATNSLNLHGLAPLVATSPMNLFGLVTSMAPNPTKIIWLGDIHDPEPYRFIWLGDIHGAEFRQKHCHKNTDHNIGPGGKERRLGAQEKRPETKKICRNSETLPRR